MSHKASEIQDKYDTSSVGKTTELVDDEDSNAKRSTRAAAKSQERRSRNQLKENVGQFRRVERTEYVHCATIDSLEWSIAQWREQPRADGGWSRTQNVCTHVKACRAVVWPCCGSTKHFESSGGVLDIPDLEDDNEEDLTTTGRLCHCTSSSSSPLRSCTSTTTSDSKVTNPAWTWRRL